MDQLMDEVTAYLATVDLFRQEGSVPVYEAEPRNETVEVYSVIRCPSCGWSVCVGNRVTLEGLVTRCPMCDGKLFE